MDYSNLFKEAAIGDTYNIKEEMKLIEQYQTTSDPFVLRQLKNIYKGVITRAEMSSPKYGLDSSAVSELSLKFFIIALRTYRKSKSGGSKPSTYIYDTIRKKFQTENYKRQDITRKRDDLARESHDVYNAKVKLELEDRHIDPLSIQQTIMSMKRKSDYKPISISNITRIEDLDRTEYSGGMLTSGDTGEQVRFEDVSNVDRTSGEELLNKEVKIKRLNKAINQLSPTEANIFKDKHGFGGHDKLERWDLLALNNNLPSVYMVKKIYAGAASKIRNLIE